MSQERSSSPKASWQSVSKRKKEEQNGRIPKEWKLSSLPGADVKNYTDIPRKSGLLTKTELDITEQYDAVALAEAIKANRLTCIDVTRAFCKVCLFALNRQSYSRSISNVRAESGNSTSTH
jgi:hypothetical protein